jgi:hypothetical protein
MAHIEPTVTLEAAANMLSAIERLAKPETCAAARLSVLGSYWMSRNKTRLEAVVLPARDLLQKQRETIAATAKEEGREEFTEAELSTMRDNLASVIKQEEKIALTSVAFSEFTGPGGDGLMQIFTDLGVLVEAPA